MSPLQQLKELLNDKFIDGGGKVHQATASKGLTMPEIEALRQLLPGKGMPDEIVELLRFASGFDCDFFEGISFTNVDTFNLEAFFPNIVELGGDGLGNYWLVDVDYEGNWGPVYFACHDPAVIMKQAENLGDFIRQIHDHAKQGEKSLFHQLYGHSIYSINKLPRGGFITTEAAKTSGDKELMEFAAKLPPDYLVADLRNKPVGAGFAWAQYYSVKDKEIRCKDIPLWGVQPKRRNFLDRLFGKK